MPREVARESLVELAVLIEAVRVKAKNSQVGIDAINGACVPAQHFPDLGVGDCLFDVHTDLSASWLLLTTTQFSACTRSTRWPTRSTASASASTSGSSMRA